MVFGGKLYKSYVRIAFLLLPCIRDVMIFTSKIGGEMIRRGTLVSSLFQRELCSRLCTQVESRDWRAALSTASKPCSQRQGLRAMEAEAARPLPYHLAPLLLKPLATLLRQLHSSCLPLPHIPVAIAAAAVCRVGEDDNAQLEGILQKLGAVERSTLDAKEGAWYRVVVLAVGGGRNCTGIICWCLLHIIVTTPYTM